MMDTTDRLARQPSTTSMTDALAQQLAPLPDQPTAVQVRELVALCHQMSQQYQECPETCMARSWWRLFNQAGIRLHEVLDQARAEGYQGLSDEEAERAYFLLIHVAYFFTPGGVAEALWPMLPAEPGVEETKLSTNEALGVAFGRQPQAPQHTWVRRQVSHWKQRVAQMLGKTAPDSRRAIMLRELAMYDLPPLEEDSAQPHHLVTRRPVDGAHTGG